MTSTNPPAVAILGTRGYPSYYGGFETAVRHIAPFLADRGWDVTVYGRSGALRPDDPGRDPRVRSVTTAGVESRSLSTLTYGLTSALHAAGRRPDVALVMNVANGFWLPLLRARGIPTVVNVDGIEWEREKWNRAGKAVFRAGARATARWATELVHDAEAIGERWAREFGRAGEYIAYGATPPVAPPLETGLEPGSYALFVARFVPENTVAEFLDATERLAERHPVVLVGSSGYGGEFDARAEALAKRFERVRWLGHIHDDARLDGLWAHAGAYFHGHSVGGTNPALVQAMACGAPIVARDTVYNREVLGADAAGFVPPDADRIALAIDTLLTDDGRRTLLRERALARVRERYSWESVCARYETVLLRTIENGPKRTR